MIPTNVMREKIGTTSIILALFGVVSGLHAEEITLFTPNSPPGATRTLSFPSDQCMGNLYLVPDSGPDWDLKRVEPIPQWDYLAAAQGEVCVPVGNVKLTVGLALSPREAASLRRQNPSAHQMLIADRARKDPEDLSGLLELDPNGLFWLSVGSAMYQRTGADPGIFDPIRDLTGLCILTFQSTGVTDEGLECLRPLRSLRGLELTQFRLGSRGLAVLKELSALEYLLLNTGVTDAGLKQVAQIPGLRWLHIVDGRMWGPGLAELAHLPKLERLCIHQSIGQISDRHIKNLEGLTRLKSLTLWSSGCNSLTDASLASIGKLKNLEELHFICADPRFTPAGIGHLQNLKQLKVVDFGSVWSGPTGVQQGDEVARQLTGLPNLESIKGIGFLTAEGMQMLTTFRNLKCLHVALKGHRFHGYQGPTGLSHLADLASLEDLSILSQDALSARDLANLESLTHLRELSIMAQTLPDQGLASVGKLKKLERLDLSLLHGVNCAALNQLNGLRNLQYLSVTAPLPAYGVRTKSSNELMLDLSGLKQMKDLDLAGLPLQDADLAFLDDMPLLEDLALQSTTAPLSGTFLRYLGDLPKLHHLLVNGLSSCTGKDLENLNGLPKLRDIYLRGNITDTALQSLTGLSALETLRVDTDYPIQEKTVSDLKRSHPVIEYIHINELWKSQPPPERRSRRTRVSRPRTDRRHRGR